MNIEGQSHFFTNIFQVLYVLCFTRPSFQVSVYRTIGPLVAYAKTKTQISFVVTAKLISAFVFASQKVQSLYFLNTKFQASSHLVWSCSLVCVGPGRKPRRPVFSQRGSIKTCCGYRNCFMLCILIRIAKPQTSPLQHVFMEIVDKNNNSVTIKYTRYRLC